MAPPRSPAPVNRPQRILAFMVGGIVLLSVTGLVTVFIGVAAGADMASGVFPVANLTALIGFPIAMLLVIAIFIFTLVGRSRSARDARR